MFPCPEVNKNTALNQLKNLGLKLNVESFYQAASNGALNNLCLLLRAGLDVDLVTSKGGPAIVATVKNNQYEATEFLLKNGADPNLGIPYDPPVMENGVNIAGYTPLMFASQNGNRDIVLLLLNAGALTDLHSSDGETSLTLAEKTTTRIFLRY